MSTCAHESAPIFATVTYPANRLATELRLAGDVAWEPYDLLMHSASGEVVRLDSPGNGDGWWNVTRGIGSRPATMLDGDEILRVGNCRPENAA